MAAKSFRDFVGIRMTFPGQTLAGDARLIRATFSGQPNSIGLPWITFPARSLAAASALKFSGQADSVDAKLRCIASSGRNPRLRLVG